MIPVYTPLVTLKYFKLYLLLTIIMHTVLCTSLQVVSCKLVFAKRRNLVDDIIRWRWHVKSRGLCGNFSIIYIIWLISLESVIWQTGIGVRWKCFGNIRKSCTDPKMYRYETIYFKLCLLDGMYYYLNGKQQRIVHIIYLLPRLYAVVYALLIRISLMHITYLITFLKSN